jgi:hypothetical protein
LRVGGGRIFEELGGVVEAFEEQRERGFSTTVPAPRMAIVVSRWCGTSVGS